MAYIGKQPLVGNYTVLDSLTATTTDTYALTKNSVAVFPQTPANCIVSLNGVIQAPFDSYTISGSNIVFASALTASDSIDFITVLGDVLNVGTVSDGTIGLAKLSATGTPSSSTFLRGDNTWQSAGGANTPVFYAQKNVNQSILNFTNTKMEINSEIIDTAGNYDNSTNYRFTPTTAGKYFLFASCLYQNFTANKLFSVTLSKNGSGIQSVVNSSGNVTDDMSAYIGLIVEANGTSDYFEAFTFHSAGVTLTLAGGFFGGYRIIE